MINKKTLKKNFSKGAKDYDTYAIMQKKMANKIIDIIKYKINHFNCNTNILDVGCGTGYLTNEINNIFKQSKIAAIDIAPGMIEVAKEKLDGKNILFRCGDIEEININDTYDLIVSNATFQWVNDFEKTVIKLYSKLKNNGYLVFSIFGDKTFTELHQSYNKAKKCLNINNDASPGQSFYSLREIINIFNSTIKCNNIDCWESIEYEYFDTVREFLVSIKKIGANNCTDGLKCVNPKLIKNMMDFYHSDFRCDNKIKVTYHNIFIAVYKSGNSML